jgi:hypothetical protein
MKERIRRVFTYPSGNILALANFALIGFNQSYSSTMPESYRRLIFSLNFPAIILEKVLIGELLVGLVTPLLIYLQWVIIGWFAKAAAARIDRRSVKLP